MNVNVPAAPTANVVAFALVIAGAVTAHCAGPGEQIPGGRVADSLRPAVTTAWLKPNWVNVVPELAACTPTVALLPFAAAELL